mmetsp:Transcript_37768/g.96648  ORF Transcript_37768/g.96648 Transcript_37768/m.96648 type:complete len:566 (-) Transcript_37768:223-1920(-)
MPGHSPAPLALDLTADHALAIRFRVGDAAARRASAMKNAVDARLKTRQAAISLNTRRAAEPLRLRRPVMAPARPRLARQAQSADLGSTGTPRMAARRPRSAGVNPLARLERLAGSGLVRPRRATGPRAATITGQGSRDAGGAGRLRLEEDGRATAVLPQAGRLHKASALHVISSADGSGWQLLCAWATETKGQSGSAIALSRLTSGDDKWQQPSFVVRTEKRGIEQPQWLSDGRTGELRLMYINRGSSIQTDSVVQSTESADLGETWGTVQTTIHDSGVKISSPPLQDGADAWLLPVHRMPQGDSPGRNELLRSTDGGRSWQTDAPMTPKGGPMLHQPSIVRVLNASSGREHHVAFYGERCCVPDVAWSGAVFRSAQCEDAAKSWSSPEALTALPRRARDIQVITLRSGRVAILVGHHREADAAEGDAAPQDVNTYLTLALSGDDGATWESVRDLGLPYLSGASPSMVQTPDGYIHISYTHVPFGHAEGQEHTIRHLRVTEHWIQRLPVPKTANTAPYGIAASAEAVPSQEAASPELAAQDSPAHSQEGGAGPTEHRLPTAPLPP